MILNVIAEEQTHQVTVPDALLEEAVDFFAKMNSDMDRGWQMSRTWVERPSQADRCRIAADKLYSAMHSNNTRLATLLAGYVLKHAWGIHAVAFDAQGEVQDIELVMGPGFPPPSEEPTGPASAEEIRAIAEQQVSKVYKSGRKHRFAVLETGTGKWIETAVAGDEAEAESMRQQAIEQRIAELSR